MLAATSAELSTTDGVRCAARVHADLFSVCVCVCRLSVLQGQVVLAVRQQYVAIDDQLLTLGDGDEVAVVPPLSGG